VLYLDDLFAAELSCIFLFRYLENCRRVVDGGSLCTRNGRFIEKSHNGGVIENMGQSMGGWTAKQIQSTFDMDLQYDFGGHIWAGKLEWPKWIWHYPPPTFLQAEDFWMSAVLKTKYGIGTKRPRCPSPLSSKEADLQLCACSMIEATTRAQSNSLSLVKH
jgi:hypothetical protein